MNAPTQAPSKDLSKWPERVWLTREDECVDACSGPCEGTQWSQDKVNDGDIEYVRVDRASAHEPPAERLAAIALGAAGKHAERVVELEAEVSTLREHLAEQNRLLSLNVTEVERLRAAQPPPAEHPDARLAIEELKNIINARRHDRDYFSSDTEFAEWVLGRSRYTLGLIEQPTSTKRADDISEPKPWPQPPAHPYPTSGEPDEG